MNKYIVTCLVVLSSVTAATASKIGTLCEEVLASNGAISFQEFQFSYNAGKHFTSISAQVPVFVVEPIDFAPSIVRNADEEREHFELAAQLRLFPILIFTDGDMPLFFDMLGFPPIDGFYFSPEARYNPQTNDIKFDLSIGLRFNIGYVLRN